MNKTNCTVKNPFSLHLYEGLSDVSASHEYD